MTKTNKKTWEDRFRELYGDDFEGWGFREKIISFIKQEKIKDLEEVIDWFETIRTDMITKGNYLAYINDFKIYDETIDKIITHLQDKINSLKDK